MNLQELCRTCLRSGRTLSSIFDSTVATFGLETIVVSDLLKVIGIQISNEDEFPNRICNECLNEVRRLYCFKLKCQRSEAVLRQLKDVKIKSQPLKNFYCKSEENIHQTFASYNNLNSNISQIKNENIECLEMTECSEGDRDWEKSETRLDNVPLVKCEVFEEDGQFEKDHLLTELLDPTKYAYNVVQVVDSVVQDIKLEPELHIDLDEMDLIQLNGETNKSKYQSLAETYRCPGCRYECANQEILTNHVIDSHIEIKYCKICNEEFECTAIQHCSQHLTTNMDTLDASATCTNKNDSPIDKHFKCDKFERSRNQHMMMEQEISAIKKEIKCSMCSQSFESKSNLELHMRLHVGEAFKCHICSKTFRFKIDLRIHLAVIHTDDDTAQNIHKYVKRCDICSKMFPSKSHLITHLRIHIKERPEKPFKCKICLKTFRYKVALKHHMRTLHDICQFTISNKKKLHRPEISDQNNLRDMRLELKNKV